LFSDELYFSATCRRHDRSICVFQFAATNPTAAKIFAEVQDEVESLELLRVTARGARRPLMLNLVH